MTQAPDDLMQEDIASLVYRLDWRVQRAMRWIPLLQQSPSLEVYARKDDALLRAAAVAVRARAKEVVSFAKSIGIRCEASHVRKNPFLVACALMSHWRRCAWR